jgi:hypothetical protein
MEENCVGSRSPQRTVALGKKKKKKDNKKICLHLAPLVLLITMRFPYRFFSAPGSLRLKFCEL